MGVFGCYMGKEKINAGKKEEFSKAIMKLFYYGGMMKLQNINLYDKEITLLEPVNYKEEKCTQFYYNYFEDTSWEDAGYYYDIDHLYSNKIGSAEFCDVICAAYCLYEHFDEETGLANINDDIMDCKFNTGWINNVLGTKYSVQHRLEIWKNAEYYASLRTDYDCPICYDDVMDILPKDLLEFAGGTELTDVLYIVKGTESLNINEVEEGTYPADVLACKNAIADILSLYGEEVGKDKILELTNNNYSKREKVNDEGIKKLAAISLQIPARVIIYLLCEHENKNFWKEWETVKEEVYHDEKIKSYASPELEKLRKEGREKPIDPISTSEFLKQDNYFTFYNTPEELERKPRYYLCDADRLFWWDGSNEVIIDDKTEDWLVYIKEQFEKIVENTSDNFDSGTYLKNIVDILNRVNERYARVYAFQNMFYDFIANGNKKEYRAAIELLKKLHEDNAESGAIIEKLRNWDMGSKSVKCNSGRMNMKRYLSLLANTKLRMEYLGF